MLIPFKKMKKIYSLVCGLFVSVASIAQVPVLTDITTNLLGDINFAIDAHVKVINPGSADMLMLVERTIDDLTPGHFSNFCVGPSCYGPATSLAQDTVTIVAGGTDNTFKGTLSPYGVIGNSNVTYCFYDYRNVADSACVTFNYVVTGVGIAESSTVAEGLSIPYPNPADKMTTVSYKVNNADKLVLVIYNITGAEVSRQSLDSNVGAAVIITSELPSGIYVSRLESSSAIYGTRRLVVAHRN